MRLKKKRIFPTLLILFFICCFCTTTVFAEGETNMTGVSEEVGKSATSSSFNWPGSHAQGIRVTIVNGGTGQRISDPIDYTHYSGGVDISYHKYTKIEYIKDPSLDEEPSYSSMTPPSGMPTILFNTSDGTNNIEAVRTYFRQDDIVRTLILQAGLDLSVDEFIEKGYKVVVEPVAYLRVDGKIHAVTATESAILSKQFDDGYVVHTKTGHPKGKPCNHIAIDSNLAPDIKEALQKEIDKAFQRDGYYCMSYTCSVTDPPSGIDHQEKKNPYTWHLSSVVNRALPKSLFLEKTDLGIPVGNTQSGVNLSADKIISTYGIGIISYKDIILPEEPDDPLPPSDPDTDYAFDFSCDDIKIPRDDFPIREENDFNVRATFTYQQEIDCKYCTTTCDQCGLTGRYRVKIRDGYDTHYSWCSIYSGGGCDCPGYWVDAVYETRDCHLCFIHCGHCDKGKLWYSQKVASEYPAPVKTATVEIFVKNGKLDYTKGIEGVIKETRSLTLRADEPVNIGALLNAGEGIGEKEIIARINWEGRGSEYNPNNNKQSTFVDVIPATNLEIEYIEPNAKFRTGTDIISSFMVYNQDDIGALNIRPKHNLTAYFKAVNPDTNKVIDTAQMSGIVIPKGGTNLIYFKWHLPSDYTAREVKLVCDLNPNKTVNETDYTDNTDIGYNTVQKYKEQAPPDTVFQNKPNFKKPTGLEETPTKQLADNVVTSVSYERWEWSSDYVKRRYQLGLTAQYTLVPDEKSPSREQLRNGLWQMRSGYGVDLTIDAEIETNLPRSAYTSVQNGNAYLPEYRYKANDKQYRTLQTVKENVLRFYQNPNTITDRGKQDYQRIHFTPLWYPDGAYNLKTYIYDLWTPVGMVSTTGNVNQVTIEGDMYDDWYLSHKRKE